MHITLGPVDHNALEYLFLIHEWKHLLIQCRDIIALSIVTRAHLSELYTAILKENLEASQNVTHVILVKLMLSISVGLLPKMRTRVMRINIETVECVCSYLCCLDGIGINLVNTLAYHLKALLLLLRSLQGLQV